MNLSQTAQLLTAIAAFSNRAVEKSAVIAWQSILDDIDLPDAEEAVRRHYRDSTDWLMPAHVRRLVAEIVAEREAAERATPWAPGQYGVLKADAMPEVSGPVDETVITPSVRALLESVRAMLPEGSREALMPRTVAWEREHRAYARARDGEPNPHYRPQPPYGAPGCDCPMLEKVSESCPVHGRRPAGSLYDPTPDADDPALADWLKARGWDSYEEWVRRGQGEHEPVMPGEFRCLACGLVADPQRMGKHADTYGHPWSERVETGILPDAHRCADCTFVTASEAFMTAHLAATGHVHE